MKSLFEDVSREELIERCENMSSFMCFSINMISDFSNLVIKSLEGHDWYELTEEQRDLVNYLSAKGVLIVEKQGISRRAKCIIKRVEDHDLIDELSAMRDKFIDKVKAKRDEEKHKREK